MIGLDTNILARYYVSDAGDAEANKQLELDRRLIESGQALMVCKTVLLELEWVLRGYYGFSGEEIARVFRHLGALPNISMEDRAGMEQAIAQNEAGIDFADSLHHASYRACESMASFDDRKLVRRARRMCMTPTVFVPA